MHPLVNQYLHPLTPLRTEPITDGGSDRRYQRVYSEKGTVILCENEHVRENESFIYLSGFFSDRGLPVPRVLAVAQDGLSYLIEDAGQQNLLQYVLQNGHNEQAFQYYQQAIDHLFNMQLQAGAVIDYQKLFSQREFDQQAVLDDLRYFQYYFLNVQELIYTRDVLQKEFQQLASETDQGSPRGFMYRDFQGRNILIRDQQLHFIDFQGGMKGPVLYDLASLLWQAKARLPLPWKQQLRNQYFEKLYSLGYQDTDQLKNSYDRLVLIRLLQVLGAYGFRGLIQKKPHFISSIPDALEHLKQWKQDCTLTDYPELTRILDALCSEPFRAKFQKATTMPASSLTIDVLSFSFKKGIPGDQEGHGGGFVFDCRGLHNPGRYDDYKTLTGRDEAVKTFLKAHSRVDEFLDHVVQLCDISIQDYIERGFEHLQIAFGCTGGQHRSVYCADQLAAYIENKWPVKVRVTHREQEARQWKNEAS